jgi:transcriptional regulator GlxA family with amidase domain
LLYNRSRERTRGLSDHRRRAPIEEIVQVASIERRHAGAILPQPAWSGHRILVVRTGQAQVETGGQIHAIGPAATVWVHGDEHVQGRVIQAPWHAYSILFRAPLLMPPEYEARIRYLPHRKLFADCEALWERWLEAPPVPLRRLFLVQAALMRLLARLLTPEQSAFQVGAGTARWWRIEDELRTGLARPIRMSGMSRRSRCSPSTIMRSCVRAVGVPPLKRVKALRMSLARSLVRASPLTFTQIAERVGYQRLHEFSRAYHAHFQVSATQERTRFAPKRGETPGYAVTLPAERSESRTENETLAKPSAEWPKWVGASPIRKVVFVARFEVREQGRSNTEYSFPGHHIQLTRRGRARIASCGRCHEVGPGGVLWFHNDEDFSILVRDVPWAFCNVSFLAPTLPPPDFAGRFQTRKPERILPLYDALYHTWTNLTLPPLQRLFRVHAALLEFLAELTNQAQNRIRVDQEAALWWKLETQLRTNLHRPIDLRRMSRLVNSSPTTIRRACQRATGKSPRKRINEMRLEMARGLIWMSELSFKEIASRVGYARVQELSRHYHRRFGVTPTQDRREFPRIYRRVFRLPYTTGNERDQPRLGQTVGLSAKARRSPLA